MGVPGLRKYINTKFPSVVGKINDIQKHSINNLYFDVTSLIVKVVNTFYAVADEIHSDIPREVARQIDLIVHAVKPNSLIYISYDGRAPFSKVPNTRQRGYQRQEDKNYSGEHTVSMSQYRTMEYVKNYIQSKIGVDPIWSRCKIIINPPQVTGEAEHKLAEYIRYTREQSMEPTKSVIYSDDGDMIFLALQSHEPDMFILRSKNFGNDAHISDVILTESDLETLSIRTLRDGIGEMLNAQNPEDKERKIDDYVGFVCLIANDFLPPFPDTKTIQLGKIVNCYKQRSVKEYLVENGQYNRKVLKSLLEQIVMTGLGVSLEEKKKIELEKFKNNKYVKQPLEVLINGILDGFDWLLITYTTGVPSWKWMYPDLFSPPLCCVIDFVEEHKSHFERDEPFPMLFANFLCFDRSHLQLGPLFDIANSDPRILKYFPPFETVEKTKDGVYIIPMIDIDETFKIYNENLPLVTEEPWKSFSVKGMQFVLKKDSIESFEVRTNGPTKPIIPSDAKADSPIPQSISLVSDPCARFDNDFKKYFNKFIAHRRAQGILKLDPQRMKSILNYTIVEDGWYGTNIALRLTMATKQYATPGMSVIINGVSYYTKEAIDFIAKTNEVYPKYLKPKMKHIDFKDDDEMKVMTFYAQTMKSIPFAAPASLISLPKSVINEIESGSIKASCRVQVIEPTIVPVGATGVVVGNDRERKIAYVLMDQEYESTSTLHFLLNTPRGAILEYNCIKPI